METDEVGKLQKEIRSLKKQVERLEASRATFELMVDRNDNLLSRQLEQTQHQAEELNRINLLADSALDLHAERKEEIARSGCRLMLHCSWLSFARDAAVASAHLDGGHYVEAGDVTLGVPAEITGLAIEMDAFP